MPHCLVEHSTKLDGELLMEKVFLGARRSGLFDAEGRDIKVRALPYTTYMSGAGESEFIHVVLRILSGRNADQKAQLSTAVITELEALGLIDISISVEVVDMDRESYRKVLS